MNAVTLIEAADEIGVSVATVRRWVREGAPCERMGDVGRGNGALVVVDDLRRWRSGIEDAGVLELLKQIDLVLVDFLRRDSGLNGQPAHRSVGLKDDRANILYAVLYRYIERRLTGSESTQPEIERICTVLAESSRTEKQRIR